MDRINIINERARQLYLENRIEEALEIFKEFKEIPNVLKFNYSKLIFASGKPREAKEILESIDVAEYDDLENLKMDYAIYLEWIGENEESYEMMKEMAELGNKKAEFNMGQHELNSGNFKDGFKKLQNGAEFGAWGSEKDYLDRGILDPGKKWDGKEKINTLAYILECGAGDNIIFSRFVYQAAKSCRNLVLYTRPDMIRLFADSLYHMDLPIESYDVRPLDLIENGGFDAYICSFQAPYILDLETPIVPDAYIKTFPEMEIENKVSNIRHKTQKPIITMKYFGNPDYNHDVFRKFPPEPVILSCVKRGTVINCQLDDDSYYDITIPAKNMIKDWKDTASIIRQSDVVISSCTGLAHLSASMGKTTIVIVPCLAYFVWQTKYPKQRWYNNHVHVIKQKEVGKWNDCFEELDKILDTLGYTEIDD